MDHYFSEKSLYGTGQIEAALASLEAKGPALRGGAGAAEGQAAGGLGAAGADALPLDRLRRRHRPAGEEVGRRLDLLRAGHRLSLQQDRARLRRADRRAGRRPRRLCQADEGGGGGAQRRAGAARREALPAGAALQGRRAVQDVEAGRDLRDAARRDRAGGAGRDAVRDADAEERRAARISTSTRCWSSRRTIRSSTCSMPTRGRSRCLRGPRRRGSRPTTGRWRRRTSGGSGRPGELALARKMAEWPRQVEIAAAAHEPHRIAFYLYELASEFHALQHQGKLDPALRFIREDAPGVSAGAAGAGAGDAGGDQGGARHPRGDADGRDALRNAPPVVIAGRPAILGGAPRARCGKRIR